MLLCSLQLTSYIIHTFYRQRQRKHKEKMKQREKIAKKLQTHRPGEAMDGHDMELFKLSTIKSQQHLNTLENTEVLKEELSNDGGVADDQEGVCSYHVLHS